MGANSAPKQADKAPVAPVALGALAEAETITRSERVYVDVPGTRKLADDGRLIAVRRERRADGSLGAMVVHFVRRDPASGREIGNPPATLLDWEAASIAFERAGVKLVRSAAEFDAAHAPQEAPAA